MSGIGLKKNLADSGRGHASFDAGAERIYDEMSRGRGGGVGRAVLYARGLTEWLGWFGMTANADIAEQGRTLIKHELGYSSQAAVSVSASRVPCSHTNKIGMTARHSLLVVPPNPPARTEQKCPVR